MKIFGIGLNKTGTKTLKSCFEILGYTDKTHDLSLLKAFYNNEFDLIDQTVKCFDTFEDWPWPLMYKYLDKKYPESKFILTTRKSSEIWFNSLYKHSLRTGPTEHRKIVYGYEMPQENKSHHIDYYENHNQRVREYFKNQENKFLEVCWENGDEWKKLCTFLEKELPIISFPHENKTKT